MQSDLTNSDTGSSAVDWLIAETHCSEHAAQQAVRYVAAQQAAVQVVPTQTTVVFERFFDDTGGMQLVVHAPFGGRINRAWGLAMRKRFCRSFDFELQATADDDGFILSLGPQHSFPIESLFPMLRPDNVRGLLEQALLVNPMFHLRWRWNASRALQLERMRNGKKVPPALQRFRSQDLLTAVFPKLTGCQEEHTGDHEIPDHPLVQQTMHDCLHEALDLEALLDLLGRVERGEITFVARDTREPSPFAYELLNANPYAFLDGGEVQERRTRMAETGRTLTIESVRDLGRLDPIAIRAVMDEAQPLVRNADELHDVLLSRYLLPLPSSAASATSGSWQSFFEELRDAGRAVEVTFGEGRTGWTATERWEAVLRLFPDAACRPSVTVPPELACWDESADVGVALLRGYMEIAGPQTAPEIAAATGLEASRIAAALEALEGEGCVLRGTFRPESSVECPVSRVDARPPHFTGDGPHSTHPEWCHRRLLQRIHRLTVAGLRKEIQPVDVATYLRFLLRHQGVGTSQRAGVDGLFEVITQLQGMDIPSVAWEEFVLPQRVAGYRRDWLDELCLTGEVGWGRLFPPPRDPERSRPMASLTRVAPVSLFLREDLPWLSAGSPRAGIESLSSVGRQVLEQLRARGAMFATDILAEASLLPTQLDDVLGELVARGVVTSDGFAGLRGLIRESEDAESERSRRRGPKLVRRRRSVVKTGRWSVWRDAESRAADSKTASTPEQAGTLEQWAWQMLRRWGVVFRDLVEKESGSPAWWALVPVLRRLEMRGEIRGGRFITGVGGEQYASSEAVQQLRQLRRDDGEAKSPQDPAEPSSELVVLSAADPLNLVGIITPHARVPSLASNRIFLHRGVPIADLQAGRLTIYPECPGSQQAAVAELAGVAPTTPDSPGTGVEEDRHARRFANRKVRAPLLPKRPRPLIS